MHTRTLTISAMLTAACGTQALAQTTPLGPDVFRVESGVEFTMGNLGASDFVFNWADAGGMFVTNDPTLELIAGQTYLFRFFFFYDTFFI